MATAAILQGAVVGFADGSLVVGAYGEPVNWICSAASSG